jgi:sugar phosphate isomerase/epimerase
MKTTFMSFSCPQLDLDEMLALAKRFGYDGDQVEGKLVLLPMGEGIVDTRRAVELLRTIDYQGYLSGEWIDWEPYEIHLPRELATLKEYGLGA